MKHALTVAALAALFATAAPTQDWAPGPATGPSARQLPRMAFDYARAQTVLYGGYDRGLGGARSDTWLFDGTTWTPATPATNPPPLDTHAMSYDSGRDVVTMFGGLDTGAFPGSITNDTWEWNGTDWSLQSPATSPSARFGPAMAFDPLRAVTVMFGGSTASGQLSDTWEWDGITWTQRFPATTPSARSNHAMAFDFVRGTVVMFGGSGGGAQLGDTWEYDGTDWAPVASSTSPPARTGHGLAFDATRGALLLFGGRGPAPMGDSWELQFGEWHEYQQATVPGGAGRVNLAMTYDLARAKVVVFGGATGSADLADTWQFEPNRPSYAAFGVGCAGSAGTPRLDASSLPALGTAFNLQVSGAPAGALTFLVWGFTGRADLPIPGTSCTQRVLPPLDTLTAFATTGVANYSLPVPNDPSLVALIVHFQAAVLDPVNNLGLTVTNAGRAFVY